MGNASSSEETFESTQIQRVYNESVVKMAQNCDTRVGNTVKIVITGDNNQITGLWVNQDINWTVDCVANFFNDREFYNELTAGLEDLASTGKKEINFFGVSIPVPNIATDTTVNTTQILESTTRLYSQFNQDCSQEVQNLMDFTIDGNYNTVEDTTVEQMVNGMTTCYFDVTNQEKVVNDLDSIVRGNTDVGIGIFGWIIIAVIIIVVLIILLVIVVAIVRAVRGGGDKKKEGQMERNPYAGMEGQMGGYQGEGQNPYGGEGNPYAGGGYGGGQMGYEQMGYGQMGGYPGGGGGGYPPAGY